MTVKELIEELQKLPQDAQMYVDTDHYGFYPLKYVVDFYDVECEVKRERVRNVVAVSHN